jgi:hypothetical protein
MSGRSDKGTKEMKLPSRSRVFRVIGAARTAGTGTRLHGSAWSRLTKFIVAALRGR